MNGKVPMAEQSGLTQEVCPLSFPTMTGHFQHSYHSRGENSLLVLDLRATAYNLVFLFYFFFPLPVEPFMRMIIGFHIFLYYIFAILGWKWEVEEWSSKKPHTMLTRSPDLCFRNISLEWLCSEFEGTEVWDTSFVSKNSRKRDKG